jgi:hypothetical protein
VVMRNSCGMKVTIRHYANRVTTKRHGRKTRTLFTPTESSLSPNI